MSDTSAARGGGASACGFSENNASHFGYQNAHHLVFPRLRLASDQKGHKLPQTMLWPLQDLNQRLPELHLIFYFFCPLKKALTFRTAHPITPTWASMLWVFMFMFDDKKKQACNSSNEQATVWFTQHSREVFVMQSAPIFSSLAPRRRLCDEMCARLGVAAFVFDSWSLWSTRSYQAAWRNYGDRLGRLNYGLDGVWNGGGQPMLLRCVSSLASASGQSQRFWRRFIRGHGNH